MYQYSSIISSVLYPHHLPSFNDMRILVDKLKISHEKFTDQDFGPKAVNDDEFGSASVGPAPPSPVGVSKYPKPDTLRWDRPV